MAGQRLPFDVIEARGAKHMTKAEKAARQAGEVKIKEEIKRLTPPKWLPQSQREEFNRVSAALLKLMPTLVARTDADTIATYCMARTEWLHATKLVNAALASGNLDDAKGWGLVQDRFFKQARACAGDLGLTISSRCRLVLPEGARKPKEDNAFERLLRERERRA